MPLGHGTSKVESIYFTRGSNEVVEDVAGQGVESAANLNINPKYLLLLDICSNILFIYLIPFRCQMFMYLCSSEVTDTDKYC